MNQYLKFGLMMVISFVIMYTVMFLNVSVFDHVMLSKMRTYMTILMIAPMAVFMLLFMWKMYTNRTVNYTIMGLAVIIFALTFFMMRNQRGIADIQYMKGMIPHHSSAILTSENAKIQNPEVKKLANEIIKAQKEEIAEMKVLIDKLENQ